MERALQKASIQLKREPDDCSLARRVMTLFDQGARDKETIAQTAAYQERLVTQIARLRGVCCGPANGRRSRHS
jgi:hypothetical protein